MIFLRFALLAFLALGLSACGSKFKTYNGPAVTSIQVHKAERRMYVMHNDQVLKAYDVALGRAPVGHKQFEGDQKTPEGVYLINRRNPRSQFHLSLGISYPDVEDVAYARSQGRRPGGEIFIHGMNGKGRNKGDWTWGCIAVTNSEMEDIYAMVRDNTPIFIFAQNPATAVAQLENTEVLGMSAAARGVTP